MVTSGYGWFLPVLGYVRRVSPGTQMEGWPLHFLLRETALSQFDKSQLETPFALGMHAFMSLFSIFLPATAVAASCTLACICDSCLSQLHLLTPGE